MTSKSGPFLRIPHTKPGWWSAGLAILFVLLFSMNVSAIILLTNNPSTPPPTFVLNPGFPTILCGLAAGIVGSIAFTRSKERSWLVWLSLLCGILALSLLIGDFLAAIIGTP